jgi:putative membrane protein
MLDVLAALVFGTLAGAAAGILPSLHSNTLAAFLQRMNADPFLLAIAITAIASARTVFEALPAIFLCVPDTNTVLNVLPGQRLLMRGRGLLAAKACAFSAVLAAALAAALLPAFMLVSPALFAAIEPALPYALLSATAFLLLTERTARRIALAFAVFLLSGTLGMFALNAPLVKEPLLPAFSGLFAISSIMLSINAGAVIPVQKEGATNIRVRKILPYVAAGTAAGMFADFLPGLSSAAQVALFVCAFLASSPLKFLVLTSSIGASHLIFSFASIYSIGRARTGAAVAVRELLGEASSALPVLIGASIAAFALSVAIFLLLAKTLSRSMSRFSGNALLFALLAFILLLVFSISGFPGLLVASLGACVGVLPPLLGVRRTNCMGVVLLPSLFYFFGLTSSFLGLVLR